MATISDVENEEFDKYRAPALERGLEIIELLSTSDTPMTIRQICEKMNRSRQQLYRMIQVLDAKGYIEKPAQSDAFVITPKLLTLGMKRRTYVDFLDFCKPLMNTISADTLQACHIAVKSEDQIVVIARSESSDSINYMVRLGYRRPINRSASGKVIFAFLSEGDKTHIIDRLSLTESQKELRRFIVRTDEIKEKGYELAGSENVKAVIDISVPILHEGSPIAALTMPFIDKIPNFKTKERCAKLLLDAGKKIMVALDEGNVLPL